MTRHRGARITKLPAWSRSNNIKAEQMEVRIYVCSIRMDFVISSGFTLRQYRLKELSTNIHAITEQPGTAVRVEMG